MFNWTDAGSSMAVGVAAREQYQSRLFNLLKSFKVIPLFSEDIETCCE